MENNENLENWEVVEASTTVISVTQEDFYNFNNNFVIFSSFVSIALGILVGAVVGKLLNGIFSD